MSLAEISTLCVAHNLCTHFEVARTWPRFWNSAARGKEESLDQCFNQPSSLQGSLSTANIMMNGDRSTSARSGAPRALVQYSPTGLDR